MTENTRGPGMELQEAVACQVSVVQQYFQLPTDTLSVMKWALWMCRAYNPNIGVLHLNAFLVPGFLLQQLIPKKSILFSGLSKLG